MTAAAMGDMAGMEILGMAITPAIACTIPCTGSEDGIRKFAAALAIHPVIEASTQVAAQSQTKLELLSEPLGF